MAELRGCWKADQLSGLVSCRYTDGTWAQGWVRQGVWHGAFRSFHQTGELAVLGRCRNGKLVGRCWKFYAAGGALYGEVGHHGLITGEEVVYLYPDWLTGIKVTQTHGCTYNKGGNKILKILPNSLKNPRLGNNLENTAMHKHTNISSLISYLLQGVFKAEKLIAGVKVRVCKASLTRGSFLQIEVCSLKDWGDSSHYLRYRQSTRHQMAEHPLSQDIYESKTVSCKKSR